MSEIFGLTETSVEKIRAVFKNHLLIEKVIIYGSRAKGNYRPGSDIDLTVVAPKMELAELLKVENEIDDLLLPQKVDISLFHKIDNANLKEQINRTGQVIWLRP